MEKLQMEVWLVNEGENLPGDDDSPRLQRMGLLAYELEKLGPHIVWWQSTFNHYQKKFRYHEDKDIKLTGNLDMKLIHSCCYSKNVSVKRMIHEWKTAKRFYKKAKQLEKPDIIVSAMPTIAQAHFAIKYGKENNIPVLIDVRDLNPDVFISPFNGILRQLVSIGIIPLKIMLSNALQHAYGLIGTTSPYLEWGLRYARRNKSSHDRVFFVSYPDSGISTSLSEGSRWEHYKDYQGLICCFFGQFGQLVDFDTIIEAAKLCKRNKVEAKFFLCGKGELLEHYQNIVMKEHLDNVVLPGWVNKTDISDIGYLSDVGLMAYKKNDNFDMQMPNKFSESLSLGLAILLQPMGVMKSVIDEYHCGIHYENAIELFEAIRHLANNRNELYEMKENSRKLFESRFSVGKVYKEYGEFIINMAEEFKHEV